MRPLGNRQRGVLRAILSHGFWEPGCGWQWGNGDTEAILETLVMRGLVTKSPIQGRFRFVGAERRQCHRYVPVQNQHKFGYARVQEKEAIRRRLVNDGWNADSNEIYFEVERMYELAHKNDPSLRERQAIEPRPLPPVEAQLSLTTEELERLVQHFAGANDPVTASIAAKAQRALDERN